MKRKIAFAMAVFAAVSFTACNKVPSSTRVGTVPTLLWYVPGEKQPDAAAVLEMVNEKVEEKIGARLDIQMIDSGAFTERMNMNMASGSDFDLCFTGYVNVYDTVVEQNGFLALDDLLEKEAPALKNSLEDYVWEAAKYNGKIYAVPNQQLFAMPTALLFQKELTEKYNFDISNVKKMDDIVPFLDQIKSNEPEKIPFNPFGTGGWTDGKFETIYTGFHVLCIRTDDETCKVVKQYEQPEYLEAVNTLHNWYSKGYIRSDVSTTPNSNSDMLAGRYACWDASYKPGVEVDLKNNIGKDIEAVVLNEGYIYSALARQTMTAISAQSKKPEKAIKLIELVNTDKGLYNLIINGLEGKHYELLEDGSIQRNKTSGYYLNGDWKFGNQFNALRLSGKPESVWEESKKLNDEARKSKLLGFTFNSNAVINELLQCVAIAGEYGALYQGSLDTKTILPEYIARLEEAGINKVQDEMQRQINEFLANK